jgi:hypothetical protein
LSDTVTYSITDATGAVAASGSFGVPSGGATTTLNCSGTKAGYYAVNATLTKAGGGLPSVGTRPPGIASFGILPNTGLPAPIYAYPDQHRFGMQGFNDNGPALQVEGITYTIDDREQSWGEPNGPNTYTPSVSDLDPFYASNTWNERIVRLDGIPGWDSVTGQFNDSYSMPTNLTEYGQYMAKVGTDTSAIRSQYYPNQRHDYYQVTWEPSLAWPQTGGSTGANNTPADFVSLYQTVYNGLHSTDTHALVMGPTEPFPNNGTTASGNRITASPGLCSYIDGVTTHGYFNAPTVPANPPELQDGMDPADAANALDNEMRGLRSTMQTCKPNMVLWQTELGISYDVNINYSSAAITQNQLWAQGVIAARSHIIILGEGAQVTTYFFGPDPADATPYGYGAFFDLQNANGGDGDTNLSPKPMGMVFAALSRILDGTNTLGYITSLPTYVHGYAFQQLGSGDVITALWAHNNASWPDGTGLYSQTYSVPYTLQVDATGTSGNVTVLDVMGNPSTVAYTNGSVTLNLTESPIYVVSTNATVAKNNVTVPTGYTGQ